MWVPIPLRHVLREREMHLPMMETSAVVEVNMVVVVVVSGGMGLTLLWYQLHQTLRMLEQMAMLALLHRRVGLHTKAQRLWKQSLRLHRFEDLLLLRRDKGMQRSWVG